QGLDVGKSYSPQVNFQAAASFAKQYTIAGHYGSFEIGGTIRDGAKFGGVKGPACTATTPTMFPLLGLSVGLQNNHYYDETYTPGPLIDYNKIIGLVKSNPNAFTVDNQPLNALQSNFDLIERIGAGYAMNTINFNRFRLYTGIRFETTTEYAA